MAKRVSNTKRPVVALLVETSNAFSRELLHGIRDWIRSNRPWAIHLSEQGRGSQPPEWLERWRGDGIIARVETPEIAQAIRRAHVPTVNVSASGLATTLPSVISDSSAIASLAAGHLMDRGLKSFGYCGDARFAWSQQHGEHFIDALKKRGFTCDNYHAAPTDSADWNFEHKKLAAWLKSLPKPVGVMSCYDIRGQQLLDVCRAIELKVPDEVAVIGQHNDELLCDLCDPPLSSVIPNARRIGNQAAAMLDAMMRGKNTHLETRLIKPIGVATRQSTDVVAVDDKGLERAARFIRDKASEPITVDDVVKVSGLSRTLLERRFKHAFGTSPYEHILRLRLNAAERLLVESTLSIAEIADRLAFSSAEHFSATFRKRRGRPPGAVRKSWCDPSRRQENPESQVWKHGLRSG